MCIGYDPFKWADNYESEVIRLVDEGIFDLKTIKNLFDEDKITREEYDRAKEILDE